MTQRQARPSGVVYKVQEFAKLAGVTVRTLHHYDRLGLLKPSGRSDAGYRLYRDRDAGRLEQIVVLKFLGLPLTEIARLLRRERPLADVLRRQQIVLAEKRQQLDAAIRAIGRAEQSLASRRDPDWALFVQIVKEIDMQNSTEWSKKYYSPAAQQTVEARQTQWTPELQERVTREWNALLADVGAAVEAREPATSARAKALAVRWRALLQDFTGGDAEVQQGLNKMWADKENWPADLRGRFHIDPQIQDFITEAMRG